MAKQWKIFMGNGFTTDEIHSFHHVIVTNTLQAIKTVLRTMKEQGISVVSPKHEVFFHRTPTDDRKAYVELFLNCFDSNFLFSDEDGAQPDEYSEGITQLRSDPNFVSIMGQLMDQSVWNPMR